MVNDLNKIMTSETMIQVGRELIGRQLTIAFAESATAGWLTSEFSLIDHAGKFLKGGVVCYDACVKQELLKVEEDLIKKFTPESMEVTKAIAHGLADVIASDIQIGVTGLTASGGSETAEKPVGTMFIYGCRNAEMIFTERLNLNGSREDIVSGTVQRCAELLADYLQQV